MTEAPQRKARRLVRIMGRGRADETPALLQLTVAAVVGAVAGTIAVIVLVIYLIAK